MKLWPPFESLQNALAMGFVFDLQDYSGGASGSLIELQARLDSSLLDLASLENRGPPSDLPFVLLLSNSKAFKDQVARSKYVSADQQPTSDYVTALSRIEAQFRRVVKLPLTCLVLEIEEGSRPVSLINTIESIASQRNGSGRVADVETQSCR
jgi:hypothetical protein